MRVLENVYEITNLHEAQSNVGWRISSQRHASAHVVLVQVELMCIGHSAWHFWVIRLLNSFKTKTEKSIEEQLYADTSCTSCSTSCSYEAKKSAEIASRTSPRTNSPCPGKWPSKCSPVPETIVSTLAIACSYCSPASASDVSAFYMLYQLPRFQHVSTMVSWSLHTLSLILSDPDIFYPDLSCTC